MIYTKSLTTDGIAARRIEVSRELWRQRRMQTSRRLGCIVSGIGSRSSQNNFRWFGAVTANDPGVGTAGAVSPAAIERQNWARWEAAPAASCDVVEFSRETLSFETKPGRVRWPPFPTSFARQPGVFHVPTRLRTGAVVSDQNSGLRIGANYSWSRGAARLINDGLLEAERQQRRPSLDPLCPSVLVYGIQ